MTCPICENDSKRCMCENRDEFYAKKCEFCNGEGNVEFEYTDYLGINHELKAPCGLCGGKGSIYYKIVNGKIFWSI